MSRRQAARVKNVKNGKVYWIKLNINLKCRSRPRQGNIIRRAKGVVRGELGGGGVDSEWFIRIRKMFDKQASVGEELCVDSWRNFSCNRVLTTIFQAAGLIYLAEAPGAFLPAVGRTVCFRWRLKPVFDRDASATRADLKYSGLYGLTGSLLHASGLCNPHSVLRLRSQSSLDPNWTQGNPEKPCY